MIVFVCVFFTCFTAYVGQGEAAAMVIKSGGGFCCVLIVQIFVMAVNVFISAAGR